MLKKVNGSVIYSLLLLLTSGLTPFVHAQQSKITPLTPFTSEYKVSRGRLSLGTANNQLSQINENTFTLSYFSKLSMLILSDERRETSEVHLNDNIVQPKRYLFNREGTGSDKQTKLAFGSGNQVIDLSNNHPLDIPTEMHWYDEISYQLQLKLDLYQGKEDLSYYLVNHKKQDKLYKFKVIEEVEIEVPAGKFKTIKLRRIREGNSRRMTELWLAPDMGYFLIKVRQEKDGTEQLDVELRKYQFNPILHTPS